MAPAAPVFAGEPAPTGMAHSFRWRGPCGSGHAREAGDAVVAPATPVFAGAPAPTGMAHSFSWRGTLWERVYPRSRRRDGGHRLRRCSRARPLPQVWRIPSADGGLCGSGFTREAGDAVDGTGYAGVRGRARSHRYGAFLQLAGSLWERACPRSRRRGDGTGYAGIRGRARSHRYGAFLQLMGPLWERVHPRSRRRGGGTGCAGVRGRARSHRYGAFLQLTGDSVGAGLPAKQATRWMAPATPVFAGAPAPTGIAWLPFRASPAKAMGRIQFRHGRCC